MTKKIRKPIPLRDFFKNPEKNDYKISPDGKYLSYLAPYNNRLNIYLQNIETDKITLLTKESDRNIAGYIWGSKNTIVYLKDNKGDENFHLFSVNLDGSKLIDLTPFENVKAGIIDDLDFSDTEILISLNKRNKEIFDAYRLNILTGEINMAAQNPGNISGWFTDHQGKIRAATTTDGVNTSLLYREKEEEDFKIVLTTSFKETLNPLFFTFDNKQLYAASNLGRDKTAIVIFDIKNAKETEVIYQNPEVDVYSLKFSKKRKVLTCVEYITWKKQRVFLDGYIKKLYRKIQNKIGQVYEINIEDYNKEEDKFLIRTYSDKSLGAYYFYDVSKKYFKKLGEVSPWLDGKRLSDMKPIKYKSRDSLIIHGYLTLPKGRKTKNFPLVVNPHGGPWARDIWRFDPEVQFLASRGYAVLQMNFRGSTGYGKKFWELSFKQWGKKMQDDITDGVLWLIKKGLADPKRISIYGGSYGGYATLAGVAFTPDLYCCAVDYVGVSNLFTFIKTIPPYWRPYLDMIYEMVGHPINDKELLKEISPVFHVHKIKVPVFVVQGKMDPRVNINESNQIVDALRKKGIDVKYMVKDNEGHGFHNEENKFEFYLEMEKFLAKYMKK